MTRITIIAGTEKKNLEPLKWDATEDFLVSHIKSTTQANKEVRGEIENAIGALFDLLTTVWQQKLKSHEHTTHSFSPAKTIMQGGRKWE